MIQKEINDYIRQETSILEENLKAQDAPEDAIKNVLSVVAKIYHTFANQFKLDITKLKFTANLNNLDASPEISLNFPDEPEFDKLKEFLEVANFKRQ